MAACFGLPLRSLWHPDDKVFPLQQERTWTCSSEHVTMPGLVVLGPTIQRWFRWQRSGLPLRSYGSKVVPVEYGLQVGILVTVSLSKIMVNEKLVSRRDVTTDCEWLADWRSSQRFSNHTGFSGHRSPGALGLMIAFTHIFRVGPRGNKSCHLLGICLTFKSWVWDTSPEGRWTPRVISQWVYPTLSTRVPSGRPGDRLGGRRSCSHSVWRGRMGFLLHRSPVTEDNNLLVSGSVFIIVVWVIVVIFTFRTRSTRWTYKG